MDTCIEIAPAAWQALGFSHVARPSSSQQVKAVVGAARRASAPLYPISTGLNWGYSGFAPVAPGAWLVDLSGMRGILNADAVSPDRPVVVIEPGVTQGQLHRFLSERCPSLMFNVTGSAIETSIIGNALERGVGYFGPRKEDLFGLEVVTGAGELLRTGFRRLGDASPLAHSHPYGLGPIVDGLFFQGSFGIVTSACLKLMPRRSHAVALSAALLDQASLPEFLNVLAALKRERLFDSVTHIGNSARTRASLSSGVDDYLTQRCGMSGAHLERQRARVLGIVAPYEWTSLSGIQGTAAQVRAAVREIKRRLRHLARIVVVDDRKLMLGQAVLEPLRFWPWARANAAAIHAMRPLHGLASGVPTDAAIANLLWRFHRTDLPAQKLSESDCGLLYISPALPMDGVFVDATIRAMVELAASFQHELYVTINIETDTSMVAICNLLYRRSDPAEVRRAEACAAALYRLIRSRGLEVYRARDDMMADITTHDPPYWDTLASLKRVLDPDGIISPGRYARPPGACP